MDTDSQPRRSLGLGTVAANGFTSPERDNASRSPPLMHSELGSVDALSAITRQHLIQLVGELSLRVIRSQQPS